MYTKQMTRMASLIVVTGCLLGVASPLPAAQPARKAERNRADVREYATSLTLTDAAPYAGLGSIHLFDDGTLALVLGERNAEGVDSEGADPVAVILLQVREEAQLSLVQRQDETFIDIDGSALAARGLDPERVVRTIVPLRSMIDPATSRYEVYAQSGLVDLDVDADGLLTFLLSDEQTERVSFSFTARLASVGERTVRVAIPDPYVDIRLDPDSTVYVVDGP